MLPGSQPEAPPAVEAGRGRLLLPFLLALFFAWGLATVLVDIVTPKLKSLFALSYAEATLTQFSFFLAYAIVSLPAGRLVTRIGAMRGLVVGLLVMAAGCALFAPAARLGIFPLFLLALFVMASGIATLQVAANPLVAGLGAREQAPSRLTLAQTFNALGTTVGPAIGAWTILSGETAGGGSAALGADALAAARRAEAAMIQTPFLVIAGCLCLLAILFWNLRGWVAARPPGDAAAEGLGLDLLRRPRLGFGALALFLYVGAEVSIGTLMVSYLELPRILGADPATAGHLLSFYWGGALLGRVIGSALLRVVRPPLVLAICGVAAASLATLSGFSGGWLAAGALIAVGLANSIMFPTIFALAIDGLEARAAQGAGILCVAIVGGAIVPMVTGLLADNIGLGPALVAPILCYLCIVAYAVATLREDRGDIAAMGTKALAA